MYRSNRVYININYSRSFTMEGKTERLYRIKKVVKEVNFTKQRELLYICEDGCFLTMDPENGKVVKEEYPVKEGTLNAYSRVGNIIYYTIKEDNVVHVLDINKDRVYILIYSY